MYLPTGHIDHLFSQKVICLSKGFRAKIKCSYRNQPFLILTYNVFKEMTDDILIGYIAWRLLFSVLSIGVNGYRYRFCSIYLYCVWYFTLLRRYCTLLMFRHI